MVSCLPAGTEITVEEEEEDEKGKKKKVRKKKQKNIKKYQMITSME